MSIEHELQDNAFEFLNEVLEDLLTLAESAGTEADAAGEHKEQYQQMYTYTLLQKIQIALIDERIEVCKERLDELNRPEQIAIAS
jgi:hypothetical protein